MERVDTPRAAPKLAIWHFLLWMACVAAIAAWNGAAIAAVQGSWLLRLQQIVQALTYYTISGLALTGLVLAVGCAVGRKCYYPVAAGHWLLTMGGMIVLISEASNRITDVWYRGSGGTNQVEYAHHVGMYSFALMAVVYLAAAWIVKDVWPWRTVFVGYAAAGLFWSITNTISTYGDQNLGYRLDRFGQHVQWPWQCLLLLGIVSLAINDLLRRRTRDWLHWTGIGYIAAWVISQSILMLMHWLAAR